MMINALKSRSIFFALLAVLALQPLTVTAQQTSRPAETGFSFDVYGDSRSMMYLPYKADQEAEARELMVDMFELVLPEKVAAAAVKKSVKLTYDPSTNELVQMVMPFITSSQVTTLTFEKGLVTEASVEDVKLMPGVRHAIFRLYGGDWVTREMVKDVKNGQADFLLSTGDLIWSAKQSDKPSDSPLSLVTILSGCEINNFAGQSAKSVCYNLVAMFDLFRLWLGAVLRGFRTRRSLMLENIALRQQLAVFKRQQPRPRLGAIDKLFWVVARRFWAHWKKALLIVLPDTVARWHRSGFKLYWAMLCKVRKPVGGGRRISEQIRELIFQMVADNPSWGAPRIHGELLMLGFDVSETTISRWMKR